ncbi:Dual-action HEIGH metallo-peptidase [Chitinophaga sp. CF118]|uniref:M57 family metalloprotease n=1 Tax=Chitinophaga sp. CF118 TaxID=1884367 RepID=UPI0008F34D06|nr:M57 family metalloprotease [Chitinophaga sp. CF118]SFE86204.1 Dual-action HEIGH metallo-peptidase [Chitinophaga sp. CF118]
MLKQTFTILFCLITGFSIVTFVSCQKEKVAKTEGQPSAISQTVLNQIASLGFGTSNVHKSGEDYIVEGDIRLTPEDFSRGFNGPILRVANTEQYRTTRLITGLPRTITVRVASSLGVAFVSGTDLAISRYNALGIRLTFQRITSGTADITISGFNQGPAVDGSIILATSGFPTSSGNPYGTILMNTNPAALGTFPNANHAACVIQHEIGHCIGLRHTDYLNRAYSCGGSVINEGAAGVGGILIPGTPTTGDPNSFMLACYNSINCAFSANDIVAMNYLY